ncbi:MAG: CPBP family intramembrane glutamic endopeptidase [Bdellovibrionales bacterium]
MLEGQKKLSPLLIVTILLALYLIIRFICTQWLDSLGGYTSYYFELLLVTTAITLLWSKFKTMFTLPKALYLVISLSLICGYLVFKGAAALQITAPFDMTNIELKFFLLLVAPNLEELIFRFFCWQPFEKINKNFALITTSLLFSYSHFHSYWFVPPEYHGFVFYQTAYTLLLGFACGYSLWKYNSLLGAILIHFTFNLGFFLGSLF